jgi:hypothetical protein
VKRPPTKDDENELQSAKTDVKRSLCKDLYSLESSPPVDIDIIEALAYEEGKWERERERERERVYRGSQPRREFDDDPVIFVLEVIIHRLGPGCGSA